MGIQAIEVNPPLAALLVPDIISSLYSNPGSLKWQCASTRPGSTYSSLASIILSASVLMADFVDTIMPSSINILVFSTLPFSKIAPFIINVLTILPSQLINIVVPFLPQHHL